MLLIGAAGMKRCYGGGSRPGTRSSPHGMEKNEGQQSKGHSYFMSNHLVTIIVLVSHNMVLYTSSCLNVSGINGKNSRSGPPVKKAKKSGLFLHNLMC